MTAVLLSLTVMALSASASSANEGAITLVQKDPITFVVVSGGQTANVTYSTDANGKFSATARITYNSVDFHYTFCNLGNLGLKQLGQHTGMRPGKNDLRTFGSHAYICDYGPDTITGTVHLTRHLFLGWEHCAARRSHCARAVVRRPAARGPRPAIVSATMP